MRIAVTGGSGYVASTLIPLLAEKHEVTAIDIVGPSPTLQKELSGKAVRFVQADVADYGLMKSVLPQHDFIIHLAAIVGYPSCQKDPEQALRTNVGGTQAVIRAKQKNTPILLASTSSNYGAQNGAVDETTPVNPTSIYGKSKVRAEEITLSQNQNIVYRFAGGFGYSALTRNDLLIHDFVCNAVYGIPLSIYESHFIRQFVHVRDMSRAIIFAIENHSRMAGNIFNIGNPNIEITKRDLVDAIARMVEFDHKFENSGSDLERRNYPISCERMMKAGFKPQYSLEDGLRELITYYTEQCRQRREEVRQPKTKQADLAN